MANEKNEQLVNDMTELSKKHPDVAIAAFAKTAKVADFFDRRFKGFIIADTSEKEIIEQLASQVHDQWIEWSKTIYKEESITTARADRWKKMWSPYAELDEHTKDYDRMYAKQLWAIIKKNLGGE